MRDDEEKNLSGEVDEGATRDNTRIEEFHPVAATPTKKALALVEAQRGADDADAGFFRDYPDGVAGTMFAGPSLPADLREVTHARQALKDAKRVAKPSWRHLLSLELAVAFAARDEKSLRAALVKVASVAVAWVEALDRRQEEKLAEVVHLPWWRRLLARWRRGIVRA